MSTLFKPFHLNRPLPGMFLLALAMMLSAAPSVMAHKTVVFAWVEGDTVYTQSKFAGGRKVKNGLVEVFDDRGNRLVRGKTDAEGAFSFKAPKKREMRIVVSAGPGHRGEWVLSAEEFEDTDLTSQKPQTAAPAKKIEITEPLTVSVPLPDEIQAAVERALDKKLKPMMKMLAESRNTEPALKDLFGGIGYILGLVGLGAYIHYRKKRTDNSADDA